MIAHALELTAGRLGTFDVPCPQCGPTKRKPASRFKPVLRVWRLDPNFATYHCARCGESGYLRDSLTITPNAAALARARAEAAERELISATDRTLKGALAMVETAGTEGFDRRKVFARGPRLSRRVARNA